MTIGLRDATHEWVGMGPGVTLSRCPSCNDKHFGETTLVIKHINWG